MRSMTQPSNEILYRTSDTQLMANAKIFPTRQSTNSMLSMLPLSAYDTISIAFTWTKKGNSQYGSDDGVNIHLFILTRLNLTLIFGVGIRTGNSRANASIVKSSMFSNVTRFNWPLWLNVLFRICKRLQLAIDMWLMFPVSAGRTNTYGVGTHTSKWENEIKWESGRIELILKFEYSFI